MFDSQTLGTIAELGLGLAGFSGVVLVLTSVGAELSRLEKDRLGIMLGSSLGATFLALVPIVVAATGLAPEPSCRISNGIMAAYTAGFLRYYVSATLALRGQAPELVTPLPFWSVNIGYSLNLALQSAAVFGIIACSPAYLIGLFWLLCHGAYQFGRILFIRPRGAAARSASGTPVQVIPGPVEAELQVIAPVDAASSGERAGAPGSQGVETG